MKVPKPRKVDICYLVIVMNKMKISKWMTRMMHRMLIKRIMMRMMMYKTMMKIKTRKILISKLSI